MFQGLPELDELIYLLRANAALFTLYLGAIRATLFLSYFVHLFLASTFSWLIFVDGRE